VVDNVFGEELIEAVEVVCREDLGTERDSLQVLFLRHDASSERLFGFFDPPVPDAAPDARAEHLPGGRS